METKEREQKGKREIAIWPEEEMPILLRKREGMGKWCL